MTAQRNITRPLVWAFLYLLAIPAFAFVYSELPTRSFFHATLRYEPQVATRSRDITQKLWDANSRPRTYGDCEGLSPLAKAPDLNSLRIEGDDVSFSAAYYLGNWPKSYSVQPRVHFSLERDFDLPYRLPPGKSRGVVFKQARIEGIDVGPWKQEAPAQLISKCLLPTLYEERLPQNVTLLEIASPLKDDMEELRGDLNGVPALEEGRFSRMLYLSASTITTAGFGDIVPLTVFSRSLVAAESVLGVVLAGLFLNAIARRSS